MTLDGRRIALISSDVPTRTALAAYLTTAGFRVHECEDLGRSSSATSSFWALVMLGDPPKTRVRSWLGLAKAPRVIVVTAKPHALRDLFAEHSEQLVVLAAPAFGWDLVDALRGRDDLA